MGAFLLLGTPGSGGSSPPNTPTLAISGSTATIAGSSAGSTNTVQVIPLALSQYTWTSAGSRTGDGTVSLASLSAGSYVAVCESVLAGLPALVSDAVGFVIAPNSGTRTQTPSGNYPIGLCGVAWLIASSPSFQALVGAANAAAALPYVKLEADDTEESGSTRPRAIVYPAPGGFAEQKVALQNFRPHLRFWVSLEALPPGSILIETPREARLWDEMVWFANLAQAILDDCKTNQGLGTGVISGISQVTCSEIRLLDGPSSVEEIRAEGEAGEVSTYFYGVTFEFVIDG